MPRLRPRLILHQTCMVALESWGSRMVAGGFVHAIWTAIAGWGIGQTLFRANRSSSWRLSRAAGWLLVSFALHWSWNYPSDNDAFGLAKLLSWLSAPMVLPSSWYGAPGQKPLNTTAAPNFWH